MKLNSPPALDPLTLLQEVAAYIHAQGETVLESGVDVGVRCSRFWLQNVAVDFRAEPSHVDAVLQMVFSPAEMKFEVEERVIGRGHSAPEALERALQMWWDGALSTTLEALDDHERGQWVSGPVLRWSSRSDAELDGFLDEHAPLHTVTSLVPQDEGMHWIRFFVARLSDGEVVADCYLDNEVFVPGIQALRDLHWPNHPWSVRSFAAKSGTPPRSHTGRG